MAETKNAVHVTVNVPDPDLPPVTIQLPASDGIRTVSLTGYFVPLTEDVFFVCRGDVPAGAMIVIHCPSACNVVPCEDMPAAMHVAKALYDELIGTDGDVHTTSAETVIAWRESVLKRVLRRAEFQLVSPLN